MLKDPYHWFPDPYFSTILAILIFGVFLADTFVPKILEQQRTATPAVVRDRWSFVLIRVAGLASIFTAIGLRTLNWGRMPPGLQYVGLLVIPLSMAFRTWAVIRLGRYFSRVVETEAGNRLVTDGPYRWIRHPAYTGMDLVYVGIALALGAWPGVAVSLVLMLAATMYRIGIEEQLLVQAFGDEYRAYLRRTRRLFPGW